MSGTVAPRSSIHFFQTGNLEFYSSNSCFNYLTGTGLCRKFRRCGSYQNSKNANDIFNWFGSVKTSYSTYSSVGTIATNKKILYSMHALMQVHHTDFLYTILDCVTIKFMTCQYSSICFDKIYKKHGHTWLNFTTCLKYVTSCINKTLVWLSSCFLIGDFWFTLTCYYVYDMCVIENTWNYIKDINKDINILFIHIVNYIYYLWSI